MAPPIPTFHVSQLEAEVNVLANGKARKPPIKLDDCPLKELVQYKCNIQKAEQQYGKPTIICEPVVRFYRQCANGLSVETTAWESWKKKNSEKV